MERNFELVTISNWNGQVLESRYADAGNWEQVKGFVKELEDEILKIQNQPTEEPDDDGLFVGLSVLVNGAYASLCEEINR